MNARNIKQFIGLYLLRFSLLVTTLFLIAFIFRIFSKGLSVISWSFLTQPPRNSMTEGGIYPALVGTFWLTVLSIGMAFPLGIMTAIWLTCYGKPFWLVRIIRISINTLAGVPSIIYGLFGMAVFVNLLKFDVSLLAGSLTLAVLALPMIINTAEEALKSVPKDFRDASLALGATQRQTIMRVLIPTALPNILTGGIISIGRVAGETAPIMFTAAT
ncbi:MAG: phosphate ABC transporter permease PstA, partial [Candidatus Cloacimonadaceae bacterium]